MGMAKKLWSAFTRKRVDVGGDGKGELARVLDVFDLTALGVGSTLGLGVYVLAGSVARETAGPAVCISFLIAGIASAFAGMCYAEFASRVPKAGSAYVYSYVTVGEFIAFVIGWNLILEYVIGTASMARGLSDYIDALLGNAMRDYLQSVMPINISFLSEYPDFFAFGMVILLVALLCIGVKESSYLNMGFTVINLLTIMIIIVAGSIKADPKNWNLSLEDIPATAENPGTGGFMPFGIGGVMVGAAKCFFGFIGFDAVASTGEEAKNPQRTIPISIVLSLFIIFAAYFSISTVLTMMWPYYEQDPQAPFPYVFQQIGWPAIKWIVNIGAIFALCTNLLGCLFPLPRVLYAMASDGVIFKFLAKIHPKTKTPVVGTAVTGMLAAIMTLIFNLKQLIDMISIGTLLAYTIVAICVLILRYQKHDYGSKDVASSLLNGRPKSMDYLKQIFNLRNQQEPTNFSSSFTSWGIFAFTIATLVCGFILNNMGSVLIPENVATYIALTIFGVIMLCLVLTISRQPIQPVELTFKVPLVPFIPCCSIIINLYLMLQLDSFTWIRFAVWMIIGFAIYFCYGISHSEQGLRNNNIAPDTLTKNYSEPVIQTVAKF